MNGTATVSIVIPAAGAANVLDACLTMIEAQDYPGIVEVMVAAADDETRDAATRRGADVVDNPSGLTSRGINLAVAASTGDVIVRVDAHSEIPPNYVSSVVDLLSTTSADCVGGMQIPTGRTFWEKAIASAMRSRLGSGGALYRSGGSAGPTDTVYLGAFRRTTLDELGGFDESFVRNQDYDLNFRIRQSGGTVWFDQTIQVIYRPRGSLLDLWRQYFQYGQWKRHFARQHGGHLRFRQYAPIFTVLALVTSLAMSFVTPMAWAVPMVYVGVLVSAAAMSFPDSGRASIGVPLALGTMHIAWGIGFLLGHSNSR